MNPVYPPQDHIAFILHKAAPPRPLNDIEFHLIHAATGLAAEYLELEDSHSSENTFEELADYYWYLVLFSSMFPPRRLPQILYSQNLTSIVLLRRATETLCSNTKKYVIYHKPRILTEYVEACYDAWLTHLTICGRTEEEIYEYLQNKLGGTTGRYRDGFTSTESEQRRDKALPNPVTNP